MGERCNRTAEVRGSIPLSSTSLLNDLALSRQNLVVRKKSRKCCWLDLNRPDLFRTQEMIARSVEEVGTAIDLRANHFAAERSPGALGVDGWRLSEAVARPPRLGTSAETMTTRVMVATASAALPYAESSLGTVKTLVSVFDPKRTLAPAAKRQLSRPATRPVAAARRTSLASLLLSAPSSSAAR